jgi:SAM-dependent methyltransferase
VTTDPRREQADDRLSLDRWHRDSDAHRRFRDHATGVARDDERFAAVRADWATTLRASHGDALTAGDVDLDALFVDCCYHEFVVGRLLAGAADALGVDPDDVRPTRGAAGDLAALARRLGADAGLDADVPTFDADALGTAGAGDLRRLYESVLPRESRLALGEYHTPPGLAARAVEALAADPAADGVGDRDGETGDDWLADASVLDPGCGSGVFLAAVVDRKRRALTERGVPPAERLDRITTSVLGIDLNPVAATSARLAYLLALAPLLSDLDDPDLAVPVAVGDALGLVADAPTPAFPGDLPAVPTVDALVGNPPWLTWDRLPDAVQTRWREGCIEPLGLFDREGSEALLGHGNDDLGVAFAFGCLARYVRDGGRAAVVLKRDLLTGPAGRTLRSLRVGDRELALTGVDDLAGLSPFGRQVRADAAVYRFQVTGDGGERGQDETDTGAEMAETDRGPAASLPVPTTVWRRREGVQPSFASLASFRETLERTETELVPVDPDAPGGSWVRADAERAALGPCEHTVRHGVKDDAKAVYALDREQARALEPDHVYPYLRSRHVVKFGLFGHDLHLVPLRRLGEDNEAELRRDCPATYEYLAANRERLEARASSWLDRGPFYTLFGLGDYTWADYKVVWCRLGFKPHFAVVSTREDPDLGEKPVVPGDHCMFVATDDEREAHLLCALLNSAPYQRTLRSVSGGGKASLSKSVVSKLRLPRWTGEETQRRLADLSMRAHAVVPEHTDVSKRTYNATTVPELAAIRAEIDAAVAGWLADTAE